MSARVWLLAALAACALCGTVENDPLPAALAELVRSGSISSSEELQLLLLSDSVDDDRESSHANNTNNRLPRSLLAAQPAQQALCKVRTEVMEVTRSMLDRSNANFLLWPPCVEVQRCSGCCNTKSLKCVPVLTHTRYLQVMKIQYANMRPVYDKAIVSVNDHVECRCQPAPRPAPRRKSPAHKHEVLRDRSGKPRSKDELHRRDELKHNQRLRLEDLLDDSWLPREKHSELDTPAGFLPTDGKEIHFGHSDVWSHNKTHHSGHKAEFDGDGRKHNSSSNGTRGGGFLERLTIPLPNHTERKETDGSLSLLNVTSSEQREQFHKGKSETLKNTTVSEHSLTTQGHVPLHESNLNNQVQRNTSLNQKHNAPPTRQTHETYGVTPHPTQEKQGHSDDRLKGNETPEPDRTGETEDKKTSSVLLMEKKALEEEKEELLLLHKLLDEEKHKHLQKTQHSEQEHQKHHQKHQHTYTTTQHTITTSSAPVKVSPPHKPPQPPPQPPRPPPQPPKKRRKHRNRISKAAMRAMLM
ncbi:uncharacterized protein pdgfbb [Astyanax mexicanus]|uniref:Platelet-derived growth factor subunit B n=2 Tax=Astyanax mexicanus TaxID=7994 RepID=A0A3B1IYU2_ASTMX|nr:uncharacterized protein pdgfbb [Astyanax mexicanus]